MFKLINITVFVLLSFYMALSQTSCDLTGKVYNHSDCATGESGATVYLTDCSGGVITSVTSGTGGSYKFMNVTEGDYKVIGAKDCWTGGVSCFSHNCSIPSSVDFCLNVQICDWTALLGIHTQNGNLPTSFALYQNFPNPFNPATYIQYDVPKESFVTLKIYDIRGREISSLVNETKQPGTYQILFDASSMTSGVYFYTIKADDFTETNKMMLIK